MVIDLKGKKQTNSIKNNVNELIKNAEKQTEDLEAFCEEAPRILAGLKTLRTILRGIKRGQNIDQIIEERGLECCPPFDMRNEYMPECGNVLCTECWKTFIEDFARRK